MQDSMNVLKVSVVYVFDHQTQQKNKKSLSISRSPASEGGRLHAVQQKIKSTQATF